MHHYTAERKAKITIYKQLQIMENKIEVGAPWHALPFLDDLTYTDYALPLRKLERLLLEVLIRFPDFVYKEGYVERLPRKHNVPASN